MEKGAHIGCEILKISAKTMPFPIKAESSKMTLSFRLIFQTINPSTKHVLDQTFAA